MASAGRMVDETIPAVGIGAGTAAERLQGIAANEYRVVQVGPQQYQFARTYRPTWAIVVGILLLPVLVGILFFLVQSTETWVATIEEDHRSVHVRVRGAVLSHVLVALKDLLAAGPDAVAPAPPPGPEPEPVAIPSQIPPMPSAGVVNPVQPPPSAVGPSWPADPGAPPIGPVPSARPAAGADLHLPPPSGAPVHLPPPTGASVLLPPPDAIDPAPGPPTPGFAAPPAPPSGFDPPPVTPPPLEPRPPAGDPFGAPSFTPVRPVQPQPPFAPVVEDPYSATVEGLTRQGSSPIAAAVPAPTGVLELVLDNGERVQVTERLLIGRNPEPAAGEAAGRLVAIADETRSVSKTHLVVDRGPNGEVRVLDRGSTNGTVVESPDGSRSQVAPLESVVVPVGAKVRFGERFFVLEDPRS